MPTLDIMVMPAGRQSVTQIPNGTLDTALVLRLGDGTETRLDVQLAA